MYHKLPDETRGLIRVVAGPLPAEFLDRLEHVTVGEARLELLVGLESPAFVVAAVAARDPRFVLLPATWLVQDSLDLLDQLRGVNTSASVLLVGQELPPMTLLAAMRRGLRGVLSEEASVDQLGRALAATLTGDLWFSRRRLLEMMLLAAAPTAPTADGTWRNLPALTEREHAVLGQLLEGKTNKDIARALDISEQTVKIHLQHVYRKLGVHRRMDLLRAPM